MNTLRLASDIDRDGFYAHAATALARGAHPESLVWQVGEDTADLFLPPAAAPQPCRPWRGERVFENALLHRDPSRFALLYRLLFRLKAQPTLLSIASDPDVSALRGLEKAVHRDMHKMRAFLRFRSFEDDTGSERFIAWFEPDHHILAENAGFFVRRFASMRWSIVTPEASAHYDDVQLAFGPGGARSDVPADDAYDEAWRRYYGAIFNPARLMVRAMLKEMPKKYWKNLPEARMIQPLIASAGARSAAMVAAAPSLARSGARTRRYDAPHGDLTTIAGLHAAIAACDRCPLHQHTAQAVCGSGPAPARVMVVAEQPGDQEDLVGSPLVGPAGQVFDQALARAGLNRSEMFITNAVKHFKFTPRGKRRIHQKPDTAEIAACNGWLRQEIALVQPELIIAMGATAARALTGHAGPISDIRGRLLRLTATCQMIPTVHPAYLLRLSDEDRKREAWAGFLADLRHAAQVISAAASIS